MELHDQRYLDMCLNDWGTLSILSFIFPFVGAFPFLGQILASVDPPASTHPDTKACITWPSLLECGPSGEARVKALPVLD